LGHWGLKINKKKCEIVTSRDTKMIRENQDDMLTDQEDGDEPVIMTKEIKESRKNLVRQEWKEWEGVPVRDHIKYLGIKISP